MNPAEYQRLAARSECDQKRSQERFNDTVNYTGIPLTAVRLNHAVIGLTGEVGELAAAVERWVYYGQDPDRTNVAEEVGDCLWYLALACNALGLDLGRCMEVNLGKLRVRYPDRYTDALAAEGNRDRPAERSAVSKEMMVRKGAGDAVAD